MQWLGKFGSCVLVNEFWVKVSFCESAF